MISFCVFTFTMSLPLGIIVSAVRGEFFILLVGVLAVTSGCVFGTSLYLDGGDFTFTTAMSVFSIPMPLQLFLLSTPQLTVFPNRTGTACT